ncbi:transposase [Pseudoalteromonas piscicida]|uniref:transposase n=1 Tax=Pseudoalteromonas piscicida TaxID=43662 RepID=UPI001D0AAA8D|nr:transposase [Pseudoalteromonas piscicida]
MKQKEKLDKSAAKITRFLATHTEKTGSKGKPVKSNITDPDSAKMTTTKDTIQGYNGIAINDDKYQIILQAQVWGSVGEQQTSKRLGCIEPVFGNITVNKGMNKLTLRGQVKVNAQWQLYCLVHNIEKLRERVS